MTNRITPEMIAAWRTLQEFSRVLKQERSPHHLDEGAAKAIDVLDNSDFMVPIEEAGDERAEQAADEKTHSPGCPSIKHRH